MGRNRKSAYCIWSVKAKAFTEAGKSLLRTLESGLDFKKSLAYVFESVTFNGNIKKKVWRS